MKSIVLLDEKRIQFFLDAQHSRSHTIFKTFCKEDGGIKWINENCAYKFIVVNGLLVIAPFNDHVAVYAMYTIGNKSPDEAQPLIEKIWHKVFRDRDYSVPCAGQINVDGQVTDWKSGGFRVETPSHMREEIEQEVTRLFEAGELTPR